MKLYLVQHGEAHAKDVDPTRPLSARGKQDVERLAVFLQQANIQVERVLHSGKLRARETAERLAAAVAPSAGVEVSGLLNPHDNPKAFDWQSESWGQDMLVVGHLPFMAKLVSHLIVADENWPVVNFHPGTLVCLERIDAGWQIDWMLCPELLN
jgi:phosphohistidine phosphatase